jgi:hypothetical protein
MGSVLSLRVKGLEYEADRSVLCSAEVKSASFTVFYVFMASWFSKHKDNFTLTLPKSLIYFDSRSPDILTGIVSIVFEFCSALRAKDSTCENNNGLSLF